MFAPPPRPLGSLRAPRKGRPPRAPEGAAQVQRDEETDDERHRAAEGAGVRGAAGVPDRAGGPSPLCSEFMDMSLPAVC